MAEPRPANWIHDDKSLCAKCNLYKFFAEPHHHQRHCPVFEPNHDTVIDDLLAELSGRLKQARDRGHANEKWKFVFGYNNAGTPSGFVSIPGFPESEKKYEFYAEDADLIVEAVNALPTLLDELRRLKKTLREFEPSR
jgi:hypothetical protein